MKNSICYIFGAGEQTPCTILPTKDDLVIAADGGYDYASKQHIKVDVLLGDLDSIETTEFPKDALVYPREKDDTDMLLAIKYGLDQGFMQFEIYGGLGGRLDHTLANIQNLAFLAEKHAHGVLRGLDYQITVINESFSPFLLPTREKGTISIFSLSDECKGVSLEGLKYLLKDATLTNRFPIGVSNEFIGEPARVCLYSGFLAILF